MENSLVSTLLARLNTSTLPLLVPTASRGAYVSQFLVVRGGLILSTVGVPVIPVHSLPSVSLRERRPYVEAQPRTNNTVERKTLLEYVLATLPHLQEG